MNTKDTLHQLLQEALSTKVFPGYAAALVTPTEIKTFTGGNFTYENSSREVVNATLYDVASLTKIISPMALAMKMIDESQLNLDDLVGKYLPEFLTDEYKSKATIRHLLTYTLDYNIPLGAKSLMKELTPDELSTRMLTLPLKCPPGTSYLYSNITAFILTQLIEKATSKNFYTLVKREIFAPLGMSSSTFTPDTLLFPEIPPTEITNDRGLVQGFVHDESTHHLQSGNISSGAAGLFASITDVAKFLQMVVTQNNTFYSSEMRKNWVTNQYPELLPTCTPLGWGDTNNEMIKVYPNRFVVKGGFTGCFMIGDLQNQIGLIILSNLTYPERPKERPGFTKLKEEMAKLLVERSV